MGNNRERVFVVFDGGPHDGRVGTVLTYAAEPGAVINWPPDPDPGETGQASYRVTEHGREVNGKPHRVAEFLDEEPTVGG